MSKAHDPHWRYIALHLEGQRVSRQGLGATLAKAARKADVAEPDLPKLTRFEWPHAIIRVHHHAVDAARVWLAAIDSARDPPGPLQVTSMRTSGTIRSLTDKLKILQERGEPAKSGGKTASSGPAKHAKRRAPSRTGPAPVPGRRR